MKAFNYYIVLFLFITTIISCANSPNSNKQINIKNEYGGRTIVIMNEQENAENDRWSMMTEYYNGSNILIKRVFIPSFSIIENTGMIEQTNYYNRGVIEKYEMKFSKEISKIRDFDRIIEITGNNNSIVQTIWYQGNIIIDVSNINEDPNRFHFYNVDFIKSEFIKNNESNNAQTGNNYYVNTRYRGIKSVVRLGTELIDLNDDDIQIIQTLGLTMGVSDIAKIYTKKVFVQSSEGNVYCLYVQNYWEHDVKGQTVTIKYYPIAMNNELYLIGIYFFEI